MSMEYSTHGREEERISLYNFVGKAKRKETTRKA
jgi:hypothetical protein